MSKAQIVQTKKIIKQSLIEINQKSILPTQRQPSRPFTLSHLHNHVVTHPTNLYKVPLKLDSPLALPYWCSHPKFSYSLHKPGDVPSPLIVKIVILDNKEGKALKGLPTWHKAEKKRGRQTSKRGTAYKPKGGWNRKKIKKRENRDSVKKKDTKNNNTATLQKRKPETQTKGGSPSET